MINQGDSAAEERARVKAAALTEREMEVVRLVCDGLKNVQIAEALSVSASTVLCLLRSIFNKLEVSDRLELILYGYRFGLYKPPE